MPQVLVKGQALEQWLHEAVEAFVAKFPAEYARFRRYVDQTSKSLVRANGFSAGGTLMIRNFIPTKLYIFLKELAWWELKDPDLFRDPNVYSILKKVAADMTPRTRREPFYDLGAKPCGEAANPN